MDKNAQQINEELLIVQDELNIDEMAKIEKFIIVHNDKEPGQDLDNEKFAHFHYANIHFKFRKECPKNITQLREMIAFNSEQTKITDKELSELLKLLKRKPSRQGKAFHSNVYDKVVDAWSILNEDRDIDYID